VRLPAAVPLLALPSLAMADDIGALTVGTVQNLKHHDATQWCEVTALQRRSQRVRYQHLWNTFVSSPQVLTTAHASSTYVWTRAGMPPPRRVREATGYTLTQIPLTAWLWPRRPP